MSNEIQGLRYRSYHVTRRVGEGAMGAVYQAVDERLRVPVALKVAHAGRHRERLIGKLRHEADVLGRIDHPAVVRILDMFDDRDDFVLVMEYVEGLDILAWSRGRTTHEVLRAMARACEAVAAVHDVGFVHLDLKPQNIMVVADSVKLLDFGTAWRLEGDPSTVPMGTPHFMSTEHARLKTEGTGRIDVRTDLYALGVTLYMLCTGGALPFSAPEEALLATIIAFPPTDPRVYNPSLPAPLAELVRRLLQKPARARHASAVELRDALLDLVSRVADEPLVAESVVPVDIYEAPSAKQVSTLLEGRFHIVQKAGSGAFASVYEAVEVSSGRRCALKVVAAGEPGTPEHRRFEREAQALERLRHPNIAAYGTHFLREGIGFLTMEYVEGSDLEAFKGAPLDELVGLGVQLCRGLQAAHDAHVIHRDLKPQNIRVTPDGVLKILDFGLSRLMDALSALTMTGSDFAGTLGYCAPESINARPNPRFDLFSSGVILYELVAGHMPYEQGTDYINQYLRGEEPQPRPSERRIPTPLRTLLEGLIQFDPSLRTPASARGVEQALLDLGLSGGPDADASGERTAVAGRGHDVGESRGGDRGGTGFSDLRNTDAGEAGTSQPRRLNDSGEICLAPAREAVESGEARFAEARDVLDSRDSRLSGSRNVLDSGETRLPQVRNMLDSGEARLPQARDVLDSGETRLPQARDGLDSGETRPPQARSGLDSGEVRAIDAGEGRISPGVLDSGELALRSTGQPRRALRRFFGRTDEIDELLDFVHSAGAHGRAMVVTGPAGIGRTRLLHSVGRLAAASGQVLWVPVAVPRAAAGGHSARQLERLVCASLQAPSSGAAERVLRSLCTRGTVVLAVDDAHRLDDGALARLSGLTAALRDLSFLVVAAFRADRPAERERAAGFAGRCGAALVPLAGLDAEACEKLLSDRLGIEVDSAFTALLRIRSAGNPSHLLSLLAGARLRVEGEASGAVPRALTEQVEDMLANLTPEAVRAIRLLALLDAPFPPSLAAAAVPADTLDELEAVGLLVVELSPEVPSASKREDAASRQAPAARGATSEAEALYRFPSPLLREAVLALVPPAGDEVDVLMAYARCLESRREDAEAASLYIQASSADDGIRCLRRAGAREDSPVPARLAALQRLVVALEETSAPRHELARALVDLGGLTRGRAPSEGVSLLQRGFGLAELSSEPCVRALARCELAKALQYGDPALAQALVEQVADLLPSPSTDAERWNRANALAIRGHLLLRNAQVDPSRSSELREAAEASWTLAEEHLACLSRPDTLLPANLALSRGLQLQREHDFETAREQFALAARHAEAGGHALQHALASLNILILIANGAGTADEGRLVYYTALPLLERLGDPLQLARVHCNYAVMLVERTSEWKDVEACYDAAAAIYRAHGPDLDLYAALENMAEVYLYQGRLDKAESILAEAWALEVGSGTLEFLHVLRFRQGLYHLLSSPRDPEQAEQMLREALHIADATEALVERAPIEATLALSLSAQHGLTEEASNWLRVALERIGDSPSTAARIHRIWGECLLEPLADTVAVLKASRPDFATAPAAAESSSRPHPARLADAVHHFEEALRLSLASQYAIEEAYARSYLARLLSYSSDPAARAAAHEHDVRARELRARLGATFIPADFLPPV